MRTPNYYTYGQSFHPGLLFSEVTTQEGLSTRILLYQRAHVAHTHFVGTRRQGRVSLPLCSQKLAGCPRLHELKARLHSIAHGREPWESMRRGDLWMAFFVDDVDQAALLADLALQPSSPSRFARLVTPGIVAYMDAFFVFWRSCHSRHSRPLSSSLQRGVPEDILFLPSETFVIRLCEMIPGNDRYCNKNQGSWQCVNYALGPFCDLPTVHSNRSFRVLVLRLRPV